jgi:hypothetical protein
LGLGGIGEQIHDDRSFLQGLVDWKQSLSRYL